VTVAGMPILTTPGRDGFREYAVIAGSPSATTFEFVMVTLGLLVT
jgi:hypothetical protein